MKFRIKVYYDSKVVVGEMEVTPNFHSDDITREIMYHGKLDFVEEITKPKKDKETGR